MRSEVNRRDRVTDGPEVAHTGHVDANPLPSETRTEAQRVIILWLPQRKGQDHDILAFVSHPSPRPMTAWDNVQAKANALMLKDKVGKEDLGSASWRCPKQSRRHIPASPLTCSFNILRMFLLGQVPKAHMSESSERSWCCNGEKQNLPASGPGHHPGLSLNGELPFLPQTAGCYRVLTDVQIARKSCSHLRHYNGITLSQAIKTT